MDSALHDVLKLDGWLASVAEAITSVGVTEVFLPTSAVIGLWLWRVTRSWHLGLVPLAASWVTALLTSGLKDAFGRGRPAGAETLGVVSAAFPSGHASNTTAFALATALAVGVIWPMRARQVIWVAVVLSFVMGWTRLALGVHWASDVLAGWVLGATVAIAVFRLARRLSSDVTT
jgi:undecaprenyl-diphosphatase